MLTGNSANHEYSAQITPYHGRVHAEIIRRDTDKGFYEHKLGLWLTVMDKSFGRGYRSAPLEKDWILANKWVQEQLDLIEKHGTVMVTKPQHLRNSERIASQMKSN